MMAKMHYPALPSDVMARLVNDAREKFLVLAQISAGKPVSMKSEFAPNKRLIYIPNEYQQAQAKKMLEALSKTVPADKLAAGKEAYMRNRKVPQRRRQ